MSLLGIIGATGTHTAARAAVQQAPTQPVRVMQLGTVTGLAPGAAARPVSYTIANPNSTPVYATAVTMSITRITYTRAAGTGTGRTWLNHPAGGAALGCPAANFALVAPDKLEQDLPAGRTSFTRLTAKRSGTLAMIDTGANQDDCKGTTVTLTISVA
jgi:hypothetical protein